MALATVHSLDVSSARLRMSWMILRSSWDRQLLASQQVSPCVQARQELPEPVSHDCHSPRSLLQERAALGSASFI